MISNSFSPQTIIRKKKNSEVFMHSAVATTIIGYFKSYSMQFRT